jgi:hypothetical protein
MSTTVRDFARDVWHYPVTPDEQGRVKAIFVSLDGDVPARHPSYLHQVAPDTDTSLCTVERKKGYTWSSYTICEGRCIDCPSETGLKLGQYKVMDGQNCYVWPIASTSTKSHPRLAQVLKVLSVAATITLAILPDEWHKLWALAPFLIGVGIAIWASRGATYRSTTTVPRWISLSVRQRFTLRLTDRPSWQHTWGIYEPQTSRLPAPLPTAD